MNNQNLNLARKWRSQNFDQIIGQDLCIRMLKNGLYLNSFFPVYLFSGKRGCGKTSTARVFAAAINCQQLDNFQKDAKNYTVPCLTCVSCNAISLGKHPDFIEIDAASHTGVDNVRNIIDASSLLPLIGRKKIYLIDEAHMLSKAAFNAFLKILEEPPASVLFILATTDVQKIIDTVRSRTFQLFFSSISSDVLMSHLENICKQEGIQYELEGLKIIVKESEGCVRDAINLLEQVRFSNQCITKTAVLDSLGHISDDNLLRFFDFLINRNDIKEFLKFLDEIHYYTFSAEFIWNRLVDLFRISIRKKYNVSTNSFNYEGQLNNILSNVSLNTIIFRLNEFCKNEIIFYKSINKNLFLELLCLRIMGYEHLSVSSSNSLSIDEMQNDRKINTTNNSKNSFDTTQEKVFVKSQDYPLQGTKVETKPTLETNSWTNFIQEVRNSKDPLLDSIFVQAKFINYDVLSGEITISFLKKFTFFKEIINDGFKLWSPVLKKCFKDNASLKIIFEEQESKTNIQDQKNSEKGNVVVKEVVSKNNGLNFTDSEQWKIATTLLKYFPGTITEISGAS